MIEQVDNFLILHGFEATELQTIGHRGYLYSAIGLTSVFAVTMTALALYEWLA